MTRGERDAMAVTPRAFSDALKSAMVVEMPLWLRLNDGREHRVHLPVLILEKNVEFAKAKHEEGLSLEEASLTSARLRFRPILMTAFAFILGVIPLMKAVGAGAGAQNVMGTGVFWGMLVATLLGVFIIPGNFTFIESLGRRRHAPAVPDAPSVEHLQLEFPLIPFDAVTEDAAAESSKADVKGEHV